MSELPVVGTLVDSRALQSGLAIFGVQLTAPEMQELLSPGLRREQAA